MMRSPLESGCKRASSASSYLNRDALLVDESVMYLKVRQAMKQTIAIVWCQTVLLPLAGVMVLSTVGCATGMSKSGFLADYSGFEEAPEDAPIWRYVDPDGRKHQMEGRIWADRRNMDALGNYERVMIDPVVVHFRKGAEGTWVSPERLDKVTKYIRDALVSALEDRYPIVDEPGEGVLRVRLAVTDLRPAQKYRTPDADQHAFKAWANSRPGAATTEGEAIDSVSGERVAALITSARGSQYDAMDEGQDPWKNTKRSVTGLATFFRRLMDEAHGEP